MGRKVAIYTRVSTLDQNFSNQFLKLRDPYSRMGWESTMEYTDESFSGTLSRDKRSALNPPVEDANRKRFDSIVC